MSSFTTAMVTDTGVFQFAELNVIELSDKVTPVGDDRLTVTFAVG